MALLATERQRTLRRTAAELGRWRRRGHRPGRPGTAR
jgi:hypothetical protein